VVQDEHYRRLERMYLSAPCNDYFQPRIVVSRGRAEVALTVRRDFYHGAGAVHGAVYFKVLDDAAFFACNSLVPDRFVLTVQFQVHLIRPISEGDMSAVGEVVQNGVTLMVAESRVYDGRDREIGRGSGTFQKSRCQLTREMGYL